MYESCKSACKGKRLLVFADTSSIVFKDSKCRIKDTNGLTRIMNNSLRTIKGLILHSNLVYDEQERTVTGISSSEFVKRTVKSISERGADINQRNATIEEKESYKWIKGFKQSKETLKEALHLTLVADREADILELYDRLWDNKTDLVIRSQHNRNILTQQGEKKKLVEFVKTLDVSGVVKIKIKTKKRKPRKATMEIGFGKLLIPWSKDKKVREKHNEEGVPIYVVNIRERIHKGYKNEPRLNWRILTTVPVNTVEEASAIIKIYQQRWKIEEFFKLIKTDCYDVENTELTKAASIRKLILYVMKASVKIQQLKSARSGKNNIDIRTVFREKEIKYLRIISPRLEGNTEKQKNPYPINELSYGAWVIARLGGWKEFYNPKRPPGSKTFAWGLEKFEHMCFAFSLGDVS